LVSLERLKGLRSFPWPTGWEAWELGIFLALTPLAMLPRPIALAGCRLLAFGLVRPRSKYASFLVEKLPEPLVKASRRDIRWFLRSSETAMLFTRILVIRAVIFPRWRPRVRARGLANVRSGLERGNGVVLWINPCIGGTLHVKQAFRDAGYPFAALTRPAHGFSSLPFGLRVMNPLLRRSETPLVREFVVIDDGRTIGALRRLRSLLGENAVVAITATTTASRLERHPFLGGQAVLPTGPVELAAATGAVILPVFTRGTIASPVVEVGGPLPGTATVPLDVRSCQEAFLDWLEERVQQHPLDWIGWRDHLWQPAVAGNEGP
jgi:lauroyl/myristoyl acyltransferase